MSATSLTHFSQLPTTTAWSPDKITPSAVREVFTEQLKFIVGDYHKRSQATSINDLARGPWYPNDYACACNKHSQTKRLEFLIKKHAWIDGYPPKLFSQIKSSSSLTGHEYFAYQLNKGTLPTEGLNSILYGPISFIDCRMAIELAAYLTVHEICGSSRFNQIFSPEGKFPFRIGAEKTQNKPLVQLGIMGGALIDFKHTQLELGDSVHFPNIPLYQFKHWLGEFGGLNAICLSAQEVPFHEKRFIGLGTTAEGYTYDQITELFLTAFNKQPIDPSTRFTTELFSRYEKSLKQYFPPEGAKQLLVFEALDDSSKKKVLTHQVAQMTEGTPGYYSSIMRLNTRAISKQI